MRQSPVNFTGEALPSGTPLGDVILEWDCLFETANLEPRPVATPSEVVPELSVRQELGPAFILAAEEVLVITELEPGLSGGVSTIDFGGTTLAYQSEGDTEVYPLFGPATGSLTVTNVSQYAFHVFGAVSAVGK
jgi:hypothetical protein